MKIARIRHLFYPDMPRDYFYELSARQVERGHQVDVLSWRKKGKCSEKKVTEGFNIHRLNGFNLFFGSLIEEYPYLPELSSKLENLRPDIVHAESHLFLTTVQAVRKAKRSGLPCVVSVHGVFADRGSIINSAQRFYLQTLGLKIFKDADRIICLTRSDVEEIYRLGCSSEKIRLIPNAVDATIFKPSNKRESNLVVWVGRFVNEKGLEYLVEAAKIVADSFNEVRFLLIGYGPLKEDILRLVNKLELEDFVRLVGPLSRNEIARILGKATIFVIPSLKEGMPLALLEAMASGVAVIGTNIPAFTCLFSHEKEGIIVAPKKSDELAKSILNLLKDRNLRQKLGHNARNLVKEKYNWSKILDNLESVYVEAIERN